MTTELPTKNRLFKSALAMAFTALAVTACYARVDAGPREECRTVVVHNRGEFEQCNTRCRDERCHTECTEHQRVARERHCWVD